MWSFPRTRLSSGRSLTALAIAVFLSAAAGPVLPGGQEIAHGQSSTKTVWDGVFSAAQADRGRVFFQANCAECHGVDLAGREAQALRGDRFWADWQETTVDYLLMRISKDMPFSDDGSLAGTLGMPTYTDIVAHILNANGFPAGSGELTPASASGVQIVKKEGGELPNDSFAHVVGCLVRGPDRAWRLQKASRPARVLTTKPVDVNAALGDREYVLKFVLTSLDKYVGYKMSVNATLMGAAGADGLNVRAISPVSQTCE